MRLRLAIVAIPVLLSRYAAAQLSAPAPGPVRYPDDSVHLITGVPGALLAQPGVLGNAIAITFSCRAGLWASANAIRLVDLSGKTIASYAVNEPAAILSFSDGPQTAVAWLPKSKKLLTWTARGLSALPVDDSTFTGAVTSVSLVSPEMARLLLFDANGTVSAALVSVANGAVVSVDTLPGLRGPAYSLGHYIISFAGREMAIDRPDDSRRTIPLPSGAFPAGAPVTAEQMSEHWIHLSSEADSRTWALFLDDREAVLSRIPAIANISAKEVAQ